MARARSAGAVTSAREAWAVEMLLPAVPTSVRARSSTPRLSAKPSSVSDASE